MNAVPRFSLVLPAYNSPIGHLTTQLTAITGQTNPDWECIVVDDGSTDADIDPLLAKWAASDTRVHVIRRAANGGIAAATNDGLDAAIGDYVVFCDHDDVLAADALEVVARVIDSNPAADLLYSDEELIDEYGVPLAEYRKPRFSPRRLLGHNYINHLVVVRHAVLGSDRLRAEYEPAQDYDLLLRLSERVSCVVHIPEILYSWRSVAGSVALDVGEKPGVAAAVKRAVTAAVERRGLAADVEMVAGSSVSCRVTPLTLPTYVVVTHSRGTAEVDHDIRGAHAEVVVVGGGDEHEWAPQVVGELTFEHVGVAGPQLVTSDGRLWSAGHTHAPLVHDPMRGVPADHPGPWGAHQVVREVSSVSAVAFAVRRDAYHEVGGLNVELPLADAVVDLCTRCWAAGWSVVVTPHGSALVEGNEPMSQLQFRDERFSPTGEVAPGDGDPAAALLALPETSPYRQAAQRIQSGGIRLLTTDVFDTLVHRPVARPHHVFAHIAARLRDRGMLPDHVTDQHFAHARVHAEARSRDERWHRDRTREVDIVSIWHAMPLAWRPAPYQSWGPYIAAELEVEADVLQVHQPAVDLLRLAAQHGVLSVAVSDIYLSSAQLTHLLRRAGAPAELFSAVITSADRDVCKWDGLLEAVIRERGVTPAETMHVGDNPVADIETATRAGAAVTDVGAPTDRTFARWAAPRIAASHVLGSDGRVVATMRETLLRAGSAAHDPSFRFGAAAIGPAMAGFAAWVHERAEQLEASTVHFLLREGRVIADLMRTVTPHAMPATLVHASRWGILRAAVIDGNADELTNALARRGPFSAATVAEAFACDEALVRRVVRHELGDNPDRWEAIRVVSEHDELRAAIVARSAELRVGVLRYLERTLSLADDPLVLCDIGWGGTIQEGITGILRSAGHTNEVVGLYLMLSPSGDNRAARGHRLEGYLPSPAVDPSAAGAAAVLVRNPEILEQINTPADGTLLGFDSNGEPQCAPTGVLSASLQAAQRGVAAFAARAATVVEAERAVWFRAEHRAGLLRSIAAAIQHPDLPLAAAVGSWHHDDVKGDSPEALLSPTLQHLLPRMSAPQAASVPMDEAYWVQGAAALAAPELLGPVAAIHDGTSPDDVASRSELGLARVAVFAHGEMSSAVLTEEHPWVSPFGWSLLQVEGPAPTVRVVRIDFGSEAAAVQLGEWAVTVTLDDGTVCDVSPSGLADKRITWIGGRPVGAHHAFMSAGGHAVLTLSDGLGHRVRHIAARCAFRGWPLPDDDLDLAQPMVSQRVAEMARKAARKGRAVIRR